MTGKGDTPRPRAVSAQTFADNWERAFATRNARPELHLNFTGQATLILGLVGHNPVTIRIADDPTLVTDLMRVVLKHMDTASDMTVDAYKTEDEEAQMRQLLL